MARARKFNTRDTDPEQKLGTRLSSPVTPKHCCAVNACGLYGVAP